VDLKGHLKGSEFYLVEEEEPNTPKRRSQYPPRYGLEGGDHTRLLGALGVITRAKVKEFASVAVTDLVLSPKDNSM